jgi:hypothetical protein
MQIAAGFAFPVALSIKLEITMHRHLNMREIGMVGRYKNTEDCGYGCKVYKCETCGEERVMHNATYGCKDPVNYIVD